MSRAVAALLERRPALLALRRSLPGSGHRVLTARTSHHLLKIITAQPVEAVVLGIESARGPLFETLRQDFVALPLVVFGPIRSDDAGLMRHVQQRGSAAVLLEDLDEPIMADRIAALGLTARRAEALLPMAADLGLADDLQRRAWHWLVTRPPGPVGAAEMAAELGIRRETLSRRFSAGGAPSLKAAVDAVGMVAAGQLLACQGLRVADVAAMLGFSSPTLLQRTSRRVIGVAARDLAAMSPVGIITRLMRSPGHLWS